MPSDHVSVNAMEPGLALHSEASGRAPDNLCGELRQLLHRLLTHSHDAALERLAAQPGTLLASSSPIRAAVYLSLRRLKAEEDNLRYGTATALVADIERALVEREHGQAAVTKRLALMSESQLEDSVLVATLAATADSYLARGRSLLIEGMKAAAAVPDAEALSHAVSPRRFLQVYLENIGGLELEPELRVELLRCFQRHVLHDLVEVYALIGRHYELSTTQLLQRIANASESPPLAQAACAEDAVSDTATEEVVDTLLEALAGRARLTRGTAALVWPRDRVLACLLLRQRAMGETLIELELGCEGLAEYVEAELRRTFEDDPDFGARRLSEADVAMASLVDLVFDYAVDSQKSLAAHKRALLSTLRLPYLRAALLDRALFVKREYPARRVLERLLALALEDPEVPGRCGTLSGLVQQIHRDFDSSTEVFDRIDKVLQPESPAIRLNELAEQRLVRVAESQERLIEAWQDTIAFVHRLLAGASLPLLLREFLERPWAQCLVLQRLRPDRLPACDVDDAKAVALELCMLGVTSAGKSSGDRLAAARRLSAVSRSVRARLLEVGYSAQDVVAVWRDLVSVLVLRAHDAGIRSKHFQSVLEVGHCVESAELEYIGNRQLRPSGADVAPPKTSGAWGVHDDVQEAVLGRCYVETVAGEDRRHKLVWIGKFVDRYLFVDCAGRKSLDCNGETLVRMLAAGKLVIRQDVRPIDNALALLFRRVVG